MVDVLGGGLVGDAVPGRWRLATIKQLQKQAGLKDVSLRDVPMDSFQFYIGRPVELVFSRVTDLSLFLPHSTDVPRARRLLVAPGAALTLRQLRRISLRKPIELPKLPGSYLAEVYAHKKLGEAEPGSSVTILSARQPGSTSPSRLKLKRQADGTVEVSLRDPEDAAAAADAAKAAAAPGGVAPGLVSQQLWAWPLPLVDMQEWVSYESLLRGVLAAHPFNLKQGLQQGIGLRLKKSSIKGVSLIHFDMELQVTAVSTFPNAAEAMLDTELIEGGQEALEIWEAVVEVKEKTDGGVEFVPVSVKRKHAYHSTLTLSPSAVAMALGEGNYSRPLGTESIDLGLARRAAAKEPQ
eukprot:gene7848-8045_t